MCLWWTWFMMNVSDDDRLSWWTCLIMKVSNDERISLWTCLIIWLMMNMSDDERISWCILWWMCLRMCLMMNVSDNGKCLTINVSRDEWCLTINVCWRAQVISMEHVHHNMNVSWSSKNNLRWSVLNLQYIYPRETILKRLHVNSYGIL